MAKRCNVCKKTYPDNERSCPYCAEAVDVVEEAMEVEELPPKGKGTKVPPKKPGRSAPTMLAADEDILAEDIEALPTSKPGRASGPTSGPGKGKSAPQDDEIDILAEEVVEAVEEGPRSKAPAPKPGTPADIKKTQMAARSAQATKLSGRSPAPTMMAPTDGDADVVDAVDLGTLPGSAGAGPRRPSEASGIDVVGSDVFVEGASEINLGELPGGRGEGPSGLDLIAEAVESGVELRGGKSGARAKKPVSEDEAASLLNDESSAVDLGSSADVGVNPFEADEMLAAHSAKAGMSDKTKGGHGKDATVEDAVDFGSVPDVHESAADAEAPEAAREGEEEVSHVAGGGTATMKAPPKPRYGSRWAGGILVGLILAVCLVGALAFFTDIVKIPALGKKDAPALETRGPNQDKLLSDARKGEQAAKDENQKLKKELDDVKKGMNATDSDVKKQLKAATQDAMTKGAELKEKTTLIEGIQASLKGAGYDAATPKDVPDQLAKVVKDKTADDAILKDVSTALKVEKTKLAAAVKKLEADKTLVDTRLAKAKERLEAAIPDKDRLKDKDVDQGIDILIADKKAVEMDRARLSTIVTTVRDRLKEGKYLTGDPTKDEVVLAGFDRALKQAISPIVTAMAEVTGSLAAASRELPSLLARLYDVTRPVEREALLGYYKVREPLVQTPQKMLDTWVPLLQDADRTDAAALAKKASFDANWVKKQDLHATPADKAKADYVLGLALRNQLNYAESRKLLEQAAGGAEKPDDPSWKRNARQAIWQMTDPLAYALRYEHLKAQERWDRMLSELSAGIKAVAPAQKGELLALSSLVRLDKATAAVKGKKLDAKMPDVALADADAKAAIAAGAVEQGNYALGRRAELLGNLDAALKHYKVAAQYKGRKDLASLYRLALARVLLEVKAGAEENKGPEKKNERANAEDNKAARDARLSKAALLKKILAAKNEGSLTADTMLVVLNMVFLAADDDDEADAPKNIANIEAAVKLAQEAIDLGDPRGYLIMGAALTQKGLWTKGLDDYITGLEKLFPGSASQGLRRIFDEHPLFKIPDSARPPQPLVAEKHYGAGLSYFWEKKYARAEEEFTEAVKFFDKDARYYYYLGLSQLLQMPVKAGAANESFRLAKRLEDQGNPESQEVDAALERVQGKPRKVVGRLRQKP